MTDIKHRAADAAASVDIEDAFRLAFEQAHFGMALVDLDSRLYRVNRAFCRMLGYTEAELLRMTLADFTTPEDVARDRDDLGRLVRGEIDGYQVEKRYRTKRGEVVVACMTKTGVRDGGGVLRYALAMIEDVTERRRTEAALQRLNAELEERVTDRTAELDAKTRELETFAYSVAHDLKAPLRGIDGYSRLLLADYAEWLDEDGRTFVHNVRASAERMNQLIDDLLGYSRLERRAVAAERLDLSAFVAALVEQCGDDARQQGVDLVASVDCGPVTADRDGLAQALRNLVDNAIKFTAGRPAGRVEVVAREVDDACRIAVRDNGIGFDMKYHDRIFEIFQRLNRMEDHPGTGIGLAIVRKAIQRMGGRVWAESAPGAGATFYLELPHRVESRESRVVSREP